TRLELMDRRVDEIVRGVNARTKSSLPLGNRPSYVRLPWKFEARGISKWQDVCIVQHHIPKAAGLSLAKWMDALTEAYQLRMFSRYTKMNYIVGSMAWRPKIASANVYVGHWGRSFIDEVLLPAYN